jgi:hypothetical protein
MPSQSDIKGVAMRSITYFALFTGCLAFNSVVLAESTPSATVPRGESKSGSTKGLEVGAELLQSNAPMKGFDIYLDGFHPMKDHPEIQMEAHHYCHQVNEDFAQCVLFDGNTKTANMNGVEYIISEKLFNTLPRRKEISGIPTMGKSCPASWSRQGFLNLRNMR